MEIWLNIFVGILWFIFVEHLGTTAIVIAVLIALRCLWLIWGSIHQLGVEVYELRRVVTQVHDVLDAPRRLRQAEEIAMLQGKKPGDLDWPT
jgi:hypothetical protein